MSETISFEYTCSFVCPRITAIKKKKVFKLQRMWGKQADPYMCKKCLFRSIKYTT